MMAGGPSTAGTTATETVEFQSDGAAIPAFLARPAAPPTGVRTVILLHDWWGLTEHVRAVARRCAQDGLVALAPDLYARQGSTVAQTYEEAAALMNGLSSQRVLRDLNAATAYLKAQPIVDPLRIGMVGFSMGGTLALTQAAHNSDLKAVVAFYGKVPPVETINYFTAPVMFHAAGKDGWVTTQEIARLTQGFKLFGKAGVVHTYPGAEHGFFNDARPEVYRADDAARAWERTTQFLAQNLW